MPKSGSPAPILGAIHASAPPPAGEVAGLAGRNLALLLEDSWLAGFIDADGHFKISIRGVAPPKPKSGATPRRGKAARHTQLRCVSLARVEVGFVIEQQKVHKRSGEPYLPLMSSIAELLGVNLRESLHGGRRYWCVESRSPSKLEILADYLNRHRLLTAKRNEYDDWLEALLLLKSGGHLTSEGFSQVVCIKNRMNRKRVDFDWSHIQQSLPERLCNE